MAKYMQSNGLYIEKSKIDRNVRETKRLILKLQREDYGYNFCVQCKRSSGTYLDCAHIESVDSCQKNGRAEKAWSSDNIVVLCRECHQKHDKNAVSFSKSRC